VKIGNKTTVEFGAVVAKDIEANIVVENPAEEIKMLKKLRKLLTIIFNGNE
jgi:hypothetical protein